MNSAERENRDMVLLLTALLSHRALRARVEQGIPLRANEQRRLVELERVFGAGGLETSRPSDPGRPAFLLRLETRASLRLPVEFLVGRDEWAPGAMANLSLSGFFVETDAPYAVGAKVLFRFFDLAAGRLWQFTGEVERVAGGDGGGMGLRFHGVPLELRLGSAAAGARHLPVAA